MYYKISEEKLVCSEDIKLAYYQWTEDSFILLNLYISKAQNDIDILIKHLDLRSNYMKKKKTLILLQNGSKLLSKHLLYAWEI